MKNGIFKNVHWCVCIPTCNEEVNTLHWIGRFRWWGCQVYLVTQAFQYSRQQYYSAISSPYLKAKLSVIIYGEINCKEWKVSKALIAMINPVFLAIDVISWVRVKFWMQSVKELKSRFIHFREFSVRNISMFLKINK